MAVDLLVAIAACEPRYLPRHLGLTAGCQQRDGGQPHLPIIVIGWRRGNKAELVLWW